jgi:hypothetical protein
MPIGFGYVEREADSYINWADVSKGMVDTINDIQRVRDEKKQLLEETYRKDLDFLTADHTGEERSLSNWSINYGNNGAEMLKAKYNLLKQGKGTVKDFTSFRQNLVDDTDNLYTTVDKLQQIYKTKSDRRKKGESQDLEVDEMALLEQYGDLSQTEPYINDMTGAVTVGLMETVVENGKTIKRLVKDPNKFISVRGLKASANAQFDNYNPLPDINAWVEMQGDRLESFRQLGSEFQAGSITEILDITAEELAKKDPKYAQMVKEFKESEDDYLNSLMANDYNTLAIFTNQMKFDKNGKQYKSTYNKDELTSDNMIYKERNNAGLPIPKFKPEQLDEAREWMRGQARLMYDKKVEQKTYTEVGRQYQQPNETLISRGDKLKTMKNIGNAVGQAFYGKDPEQVEAALNYIRGLERVSKAPDAVQRKKDYLIVKLENGQVLKQPINSKSKSKEFGKAFATGLYGDDVDYNAFLSTFQDLPANTIYESEAIQEKLKLEPALNKYIFPNINGNLFKYNTDTKGEYNDNAKVASTLGNYLKNFGMTATPVGYYGLDISYTKDGKTVKKSFTTEYKDDQTGKADATAENIKAFVNEYIKTLTGEQQAALANKLDVNYGSSGGSGSSNLNASDRKPK